MGRELFERELGKIQDIVDFVAARHRLDPVEREDFGSYVTLKLVENNYRRIRQFRGASRLDTYLNVVVQRLFLDFRALQWGKWRPSARARALGREALLVERLVYRDGLGRRELEETLGQHGVRLDADALEAILREIPHRPRRRVVGGEALAEALNSRDGGGLPEGERSIASRQIESALVAVCRGLKPEDRVILKLRFIEGCTVKDVAAALGLSERPLYSRLRQILHRLRVVLEREGIGKPEASAVWSENVAIDLESALA